VFPVLLVKGRFPLPEEHRLGANPVALVSYEFWRDALGSPLESIRVRLGFDHQVIGVLPPGFDFPNRAQIWWPMELMEQPPSRTAHNWDVVGRLASGIPPDAASVELGRIITDLRDAYAPDFDATGAVVTGLHQAATGGVQRPLLLLLAASAVFLLAACTNLASGILARGTARVGEITLRAALGATRVRLVRQLLTESALLAGIGALCGLAVASLLLRILRPLAPPEVRMDWVQIDLTVGLFALGIAIMTTLLFGLLPALRLSAASAVSSLREAAVGMGSVRKMRVWNLLVTAEVALAVTLLCGSVLQIKSFGRVMATELGFEAQGAVALAVDLPSVNYPGDSPGVSAFHLRLLEQFATLPGSTSAGFVNEPPLASNGPNGGVLVEGKPLDPRGQFTGEAIYRVVGGDYFRAMAMPLLRGRSFEPGDDAISPGVVVVDEAFAQREWPGENPLGRRLRPVGMDQAGDEPWYTVVGVVPSVRSSAITDQVQPTVYYDHQQRPPYRSASVTYAIRTDLPPAQSFTLIRQAVRTVDPEVPMVIRSMPDLVAGTVTDRRFMMLVLGTFGGLALVLALVGIYGVVAYAVAQRTREIGVRRALGATAGQVNALVFWSTFRAVVPGLVIGALLTMATTRTLQAFLYGVSPFDLPTLVLAEGALGVAALMASVIPAARALRIDPLLAMRSE
jgi:putative ABC transport system permease protein